MSIFLALVLLNHSTKSDSKMEGGVAFINFLIFDDFCPHSADAFSISSLCFTIIANVNMEIASHFSKAFFGQTLLSNSLKKRLLNEKHFSFWHSSILHSTSFQNQMFCKTKCLIRLTSLKKENNGPTIHMTSYTITEVKNDKKGISCHTNNSTGALMTYLQLWGSMVLFLTRIAD